MAYSNNQEKTTTFASQFTINRVQNFNIAMKKNSFSAIILAITTLGVAVIILVFTAAIKFNRSMSLAEEDASCKTYVENSEYKGSGHDDGKINTDKIEYAKCNDSSNDFLIEHTGYTVSYNGQWNLPNWVAYELTAEETLGDAERSSSFSADPCIVGDAVVSSDYTRSGYDRGHMAPAADMKWSEQAMTESFYMSNICPQNHNMNAGDWKELEEFARDLACHFGSVYICCGPVVTDLDTATIGNERKIRVPSAFFKAFLRRKNNSSWCAIGFIMPNRAGNKPLLTYVTTIDDIEKQTGIDLFFNLPDSIENAVEADFNIKDWSINLRQ